MDDEKTTGARTGEQFLEGLRSDEREIWLEGEKITDPSSHPKLQGAAREPGRISSTSSTPTRTRSSWTRRTRGQPVNVTHIRPKTKDDLERRRKRVEGDRRRERRDDGPHARLPELHVRLLRRARRRLGAATATSRAPRTSSRYAKLMRDNDLSLTHTLINPQVDRSVPEAEQAGGEVSLHKVEDTENGILVRGARMLATLAPFADELAVYPGSRPPAAGRRSTRSASRSRCRRRASSSSAATRSRRSATRGTTRSRPASTRWTRS